MRAVEHMNSIIDDLLEVTRLEPGSVELARAHVSVGDLIAEVIDTHRERIGSRAVELCSELDEALPEIWADRERVLRVLENLDVGPHDHPVVVRVPTGGPPVVFGEGLPDRRPAAHDVPEVRHREARAHHRIGQVSGGKRGNTQRADEEPLGLGEVLPDRPGDDVVAAAIARSVSICH